MEHVIAATCDPLICSELVITGTRRRSSVVCSEVNLDGQDDSKGNILTSIGPDCFLIDRRQSRAPQHKPGGG